MSYGKDKFKKSEISGIKNMDEKYINFLSICTSFVLTQVVLTALQPEENYAVGNGISAIMFSLIIFITGIVMLKNAKKLNKVTKNSKN